MKEDTGWADGHMGPPPFDRQPPRHSGWVGGVDFQHFNHANTRLPPPLSVSNSQERNIVHVGFERGEHIDIERERDAMTLSLGPYTRPCIALH